MTNNENGVLRTAQNYQTWDLQTLYNYYTAITAGVASSQFKATSTATELLAISSKSYQYPIILRRWKKTYDVLIM